MDFSDRYEGIELPSDNHRRVLGNLSHPRSLASLTRVLDADRSTKLMIGSPKIATTLEDCVDSGWAASVGDIRDAADLHEAVNSDSAVIDIPKEDAARLQLRAEVRPDLYLDEGEKFVLTPAGLEKLTGDLPDEPPPLAGAALRAALEANVALAQEAVDAERAGSDRSPDQLAAADAYLAERQAALDAYEEH